ncbi:type II toxin-antitoxin system RelB/DinJ family antitoxin [Lacticaseibacillus hegangensis]|uniref:Type II toxin-antitoxin system RelB/DinJ family antitoxin n=1 Tax=Lacticaseibacillus hegangensis TaxID=2486010 RepID=A0ABW4CXM0_9LACO|nr:type II toxin-antitoxin system RelB/DinJ family antitoxin [Lacticaseibacillus hegangensis]
MAVEQKKRLQIKLDKELSEEGAELFDRLGMTPTAVITAMYKRAIAEGGIPFPMTLTEEEKDEMDLTRLVYDSSAPLISDPEAINKFLEEE